MYTFQTYHILARGFSCHKTAEQARGSAKLKGSEVNTSYFLIEPGSKNPYMTVTPDNLIIKCASNTMDHPNAYRPGDKYCVSSNNEK